MKCKFMFQAGMAVPLNGLAVSSLKMGQSQYVQGRHDQAKIRLGRATALSAQLRQTQPSQIRAWPCHIEFKGACKADTAKPKSGLAVPLGWFRMRKFFEEFYAIETLHNLSVGEELGLGLNFYWAFTYCVSFKFFFFLWFVIRFWF